jgi:hypothetical protein
MKAISIQQPWATLICAGIKRAEVRTWQTKHRGDLLIVSSKYPVYPGLPGGMALCIVELMDCQLMTEADSTDACIPYQPGFYVWLLDNIRPLEKSFRVRGQQKFYDVRVS